MAALVPGILNLATKALQDALAAVFGHQWRVQFIPNGSRQPLIVTNGCTCSWLGTKTMNGYVARQEWEVHVGERAAPD